MQISVSDLRRYLQCPRSFWLSEVQGIEPEIKSLSLCRAIAVKQAISLLHSTEKSSYEYSKQEINSLCHKLWQAIIDDEKVDSNDLNNIAIKAKKATKTKPATPEITKGEKILTNIQKWVFDYSREEVDAKVLYTDVYFQTPIGNTILVGYIDIIREINGVLQAIILSSSSQAPNINYLKRDFISSIYAHAVLRGKLYPRYPDLEENIELKTLPTLAIYHLPHLEISEKKPKNGIRKGQVFWDISRTEEELLQFEYELLYTISGIQQEFYPMMPSNPCGCSLCPYIKACKENFIFQTKEDTSFDIEKLEKQQEVSA